MSLEWEELESSLDVENVEKITDSTYNVTNSLTSSVTDSTACFTPTSDAIPPNKIIITKSGAFINFSDVQIKNSDQKLSNELALMKAIRKIENYFTLKNIQIMGNFKQSKRCKVDKNKKRIIVPRFGIFEILNHKYGLDNYTTKSQIASGDAINYKLHDNIKMTHNQKLVIDYMLSNIYTKNRVALGSAGCVLNLEAGQGKSYLSAYLMSIFNKRTAIILHSTSMIEQWTKVLNQCYPESTVGVYYGKKKIKGDVQILIIDSALSDIFKFGSVKKGNYEELTAIEFYNTFGFIIYDECHQYANNFAGKVFKYAQTPYMLGLSATPDENANKFDPLYLWEIGPVLIANNIVGFRQTNNNFKATVHRIMYYGHPEYTRLIKNAITDMTSTSETISMIACDTARNKLIINCIADCLKQNLYTYVFADRREYLEQIKNLLKENSEENSEIVTNDDEFIRLVGGAKANELEVAEVKSRVILTTYQYGGTGRSIVKMNAIVFATPRKSRMKQTVGRILRLGSDESIERHIYDIVDMKLKLKNQWNSRLKYYKSMNFTIVEKKYEYDWEIKSVVKTSDKNNVKTSDKSNVLKNNAKNNAKNTTTDEELDNDTKSLRKYNFSKFTDNIFNKLKD